MELKPKLRSYKRIKDNIEAEPYLKANIPKWKRSLMCKLMLGILDLAVERGRFGKSRYTNAFVNCAEMASNGIIFENKRLTIVRQ